MKFSACFTGFVITFFLLSWTFAQTQTLVVPSVWEFAEGPSNSTIPLGFQSGQGRYQQVYDATELSSLTTPCWITQIAFRANQQSTLTARQVKLTVHLSSSLNSVDQLSSKFADNIGLDVDMVFSGVLDLQDVLAANNPTFAWQIPLQKPFRYVGGSLLIDLQIEAITGGIDTGARLDAVNVTGDTISRLYDSADAFATSGTATSLGLVTQFTVVPVNLLFVNATHVSALQGGQTYFTLDAGINNAFRDYYLLASVSGTSPGTVLPLITIPLNFDWLMDFIIRVKNSPNFSNFTGQFDGLGQSSAVFDTLGPIDSSVIGMQFDFAYVVVQPADFVSNVVSVTIDP